MALRAILHFYTTFLNDNLFRFILVKWFNLPLAHFNSSQFLPFFQGKRLLRQLLNKGQVFEPVTCDNVGLGLRPASPERHPDHRKRFHHRPHPGGWLGLKSCQRRLWSFLRIMPVFVTFILLSQRLNKLRCLAYDYHRLLEFPHHVRKQWFWRSGRAAASQFRVPDFESIRHLIFFAFFSFQTIKLVWALKTSICSESLFNANNVGAFLPICYL